MKKLFAIALAAAFAAPLAAQETHVLQHIAPENATETPNYWGQTSQGQPLWGYYLGHNIWGDEEWGEKFDIDGAGEVVGVIAHIGGTTSTSTNAFLKAYEVGGNGLPGNMLRSKSFPINDAAGDGSVMVMFDTPAEVNNEFFVTLDVGDYSHDPHLDTIVLMSGPDGSRPASDSDYGRNVIRWHAHSAPNWRDFLTQNSTPISTYFAVYPIMAGGALSATDAFTSGAAPVMFPVPCNTELNLRFNAAETRDMTVRIFDINGKMLQAVRQTVAAGENLIQLDMSPYAAGSYVIAMEAGAYRYAKVITK